MLEEVLRQLKKRTRPKGGGGGVGGEEEQDPPVEFPLSLSPRAARRLAWLLALTASTCAPVRLSSSSPLFPRFSVSLSLPLSCPEREQREEEEEEESEFSRLPPVLSVSLPQHPARYPPSHFSCIFELVEEELLLLARVLLSSEDAPLPLTHVRFSSFVDSIIEQSMDTSSSLFFPSSSCSPSLSSFLQSPFSLSSFSSSLSPRLAVEEEGEREELGGWDMLAEILQGVDLLLSQASLFLGAFCSSLSSSFSCRGLPLSLTSKLVKAASGVLRVFLLKAPRNCLFSRRRRGGKEEGEEEEERQAVEEEAAHREEEEEGGGDEEASRKGREGREKPRRTKEMKRKKSQRSGYGLDESSPQEGQETQRDSSLRSRDVCIDAFLSLLSICAKSLELFSDSFQRSPQLPHQVVETLCQGKRESTAVSSSSSSLLRTSFSRKRLGKGGGREQGERRGEGSASPSDCKVKTQQLRSEAEVYRHPLLWDVFFIVGCGYTARSLHSTEEGNRLGEVSLGEAPGRDEEARMLPQKKAEEEKRQEAEERRREDARAAEKCRQKRKKKNKAEDDWDRESKQLRGLEGAGERKEEKTRARRSARVALEKEEEEMKERRIVKDVRRLTERLQVVGGGILNALFLPLSGGTTGGGREGGGGGSCHRQVFVQGVCTLVETDMLSMTRKGKSRGGGRGGGRGTLRSFVESQSKIQRDELSRCMPSDSQITQERERAHEESEEEEDGNVLGTGRGEGKQKKKKKKKNRDEEEENFEVACVLDPDLKRDWTILERRKGFEDKRGPYDLQEKRKRLRGEAGGGVSYLQSVLECLKYVADQPLEAEGKDEEEEEELLMRSSSLEDSPTAPMSSLLGERLFSPRCPYTVEDHTQTVYAGTRHRDFNSPSSFSFSPSCSFSRFLLFPSLLMMTCSALGSRLVSIGLLSVLPSFTGCLLTQVVHARKRKKPFLGEMSRGEEDTPEATTTAAVASAEKMRGSSASVRAEGHLEGSREKAETHGKETRRGGGGGPEQGTSSGAASLDQGEGATALSPQSVAFGAFLLLLDVSQGLLFFSANRRRKKAWHFASLMDRKGRDKKRGEGGRSLSALLQRMSENCLRKGLLLVDELRTRTLVLLWDL